MLILGSLCMGRIKGVLLVRGFCLKLSFNLFLLILNASEQQLLHSPLDKYASNEVMSHTAVVPQWGWWETVGAFVVLVCASASLLRGWGNCAPSFK